MKVVDIVEESIKLEFEVSNENAWNIGLACGGKIQIFIEQIN